MTDSPLFSFAKSLTTAHARALVTHQADTADQILGLCEGAKRDIESAIAKVQTVADLTSGDVCSSATAALDELRVVLHDYIAGGLLPDAREAFNASDLAVEDVFGRPDRRIA